MSVQKENSYQLGRRPGQQGPLHEVRGVPSVVIAKTMQKRQVCRVPAPRTIPDPNSIEDRTALAKTYKVIGSGDWSCSTSNVVYLFSYLFFFMVYLG